jgi:hypothetical protein
VQHWERQIDIQLQVLTPQAGDRVVETNCAW